MRMVEEQNELPASETNLALRTMKGWIQEGKLRYHERLPSERDLSDRLNMPRHIVRAAAQQLEEDGWITTRGRRRYISRSFEAESAFSTVSESVTVLVEPPVMSLSRISAGHGWYIKVGVTEALGNARVNILNIDPHLLDDQRIERLIRERPRGIIAFRDEFAHQSRLEYLHRFRDAGIPMTIYGYGPEHKPFDTIESDQVHGSYLVTKYLIDKGCRKILRYWDLREGTGEYPDWLKLRDEGYLKAVREGGIEAIEPVHSQQPHFESHEQPGFDAWVKYTAGNMVRAFHTHPDIDGVLGVSDSVTFPLAAACRLFNKLPNRDIMIAGYDNYWRDIPERKLEQTRPLATVDKRNKEMGWALVELLMKRINGGFDDKPQHHLLEPRLVITSEETGS